MQLNDFSWYFFNLLVIYIDFKEVNKGKDLCEDECYRIIIGDTEYVFFPLVQRRKKGGWGVGGERGNKADFVSILYLLNQIVVL